MSATAAPAGPRPSLLDRAVDAVENPILLRELRAAFRRKRFVILHTTLLGLVALAQLFAMYVMRDAANIEPAEIGRMTFVAFTAVEAGLVALLFPAFSCTSITEERVTKSYELLITTRLTPRQIIFGKTIAAIIYGFLFIVATSPLVALTFLYGGVSPEQIAITYAGLAVQATLLTVYAVFVSSVSGSTLKAVVFTYLGVALLMPFLLAPLSHTLAVQVFGPLIKDSHLLRQRELLRDMDVLNKFLYWGGLAAFYALVLSLFAIAATNRIAPPSANRSTPLRLWFLAFAGLATALSLTFLVHDAQTLELDITWALASSLGVVLVVFTLAAVAFGGEDTTVARRLWLETRALRGPWRLLEILRPGAPSGGALVILLLVVVEAAIAWVFLDGPLDVLSVTRSGNWRPAWQILMWGLAWVTAFVLFVVVLAQRLSLWIQHGLFGRLWTGFVLIGITCYPVFLLYLDPPTAKGRLWHGYYLSPYTVAYSITTQPGLPAVERQLILFGPSGDEIKKERAKAAEAALQDPGVRELPRAQQLVAAQKASQARADELVKIGTPVHVVSVWTYLSLAVLLGLWNGWTTRRLEKERRDAEAEAAKARAALAPLAAAAPASAAAPEETAAPAPVADPAAVADPVAMAAPVVAAASTAEPAPAPAPAADSEVTPAEPAPEAPVPRG